MPPPPAPLYILYFDLYWYVLSFHVTVKRCEAVHTWVVGGAIEVHMLSLLLLHHHHHERALETLTFVS